MTSTPTVAVIVNVKTKKVSATNCNAKRSKKVVGDEKSYSTREVPEPTSRYTEKPKLVDLHRILLCRAASPVVVLPNSNTYQGRKDFYTRVCTVFQTHERQPHL